MRITKRDLLIVGAIALATAAVLVAAFCPRDLNASGATTQPIATPKLAMDGMDVMLAAPGELKVGQEPVFKLTATCTANRAVAGILQMQITSSSPESMMSRRVSYPSVQWEQSFSLQLQPGQSKDLTVTANMHVKEGQSYALVLRKGDATAAASPTIRPAQQGAVVAAFMPRPGDVSVALKVAAIDQKLQTAQKHVARFELQQAAK